jgi:hypothetical protein
MRRNDLAVAGLTLVLISPLAAQNPFVGKWKVDPAKSQLTGSRDSVTAAGPNTWMFRYGAFSWTVNADGTDQPTPFGTTAMKVVSPSTWQLTYKSNGKPTGTETWVLSADGKSMTRTFAGAQENGEPFRSVTTLKRVAGGSGFEGTWESTEVQMTFKEVDITPNGDDGVTVRLPEDGTTYSLKFDGKDYPEQGSRIPAGTTVSARRVGAREVQATTKLNGKAFDHEVWEVSPDGTTFTYIQHDEGAEKPAVIVLHRADTR